MLALSWMFSKADEVDSVPSKRDLTRQAMKSFVVSVPLSSDEVTTKA